MCIYKVVKPFNNPLYVQILIICESIIADETELFLTSTPFISYSCFAYQEGHSVEEGDFVQIAGF